jgi:hypothetical protein
MAPTTGRRPTLSVNQRTELSRRCETNIPYLRNQVSHLEIINCILFCKIHKEGCLCVECLAGIHRKQESTSHLLSAHTEQLLFPLGCIELCKGGIKETTLNQVAYLTRFTVVLRHCRQFQPHVITGRSLHPG